MTEKELVIDALKLAKTTITKHHDNEVVMAQTIGVLNFLIDHVTDEEYKEALMVVAIDLMYAMINM